MWLQLYHVAPTLSCGSVRLLAAPPPLIFAVLKTDTDVTVHSTVVFYTLQIAFNANCLVAKQRLPMTSREKNAKNGKWAPC
jgi:hypothetical protein